MTALPPAGFLAVLTPSLRRQNLKASAKLLAVDLARADAKIILDPANRVWRNERTAALQRRRRLWAMADQFGERIGQPPKKLSPAMLQLVRAARDQYRSDSYGVQPEAA
ncbi:hypothetical protein [Methylopila sp. 73B]|uniref:hypothetical protein n=1 Tax=Methylopila sp. 73B TaxID=1120792 RepID=UPI00037B2F29|nr:hypothetical protein [Methylopila sp. 73B]